MVVRECNDEQVFCTHKEEARREMMFGILLYMRTAWSLGIYIKFIFLFLSLLWHCNHPSLPAQRKRASLPCFAAKPHCTHTYWMCKTCSGVILRVPYALNFGAFPFKQKGRFRCSIYRNKNDPTRSTYRDNGLHSRLTIHSGNISLKTNLLLLYGLQEMSVRERQ